MELESAIAPHLVQERTIPHKTPPDYQPPFPGYSARFPLKAKDLVVAYVGAQYIDNRPSGDSAAMSTFLNFITSGPKDSRPLHYDFASVTDNTGAYNEVLIGYWPSRELYEEWTNQSGFRTWFEDLDPNKEPHGWFTEVFFPTIDRFETIFSDDTVPEGAAFMRESVVGPIREHVYWGSMKDRLPASQTDQLTGDMWKAGTSGTKLDNSSANKQRLRVPGRKNLAVIRSGQDWSNTSPRERKLYLDTMHPVLVKGMDFLRDHGEEVGCFSCRFMDVMPGPGSPTVSTSGTTEKTFGLAYFDDLKSLEGWSKEHKTHLDIFGRFLNYAKELENQVSLRLFHEVMVLQPEQQQLEYVGCHSKTGLLASL